MNLQLSAMFFGFLGEFIFHILYYITLHYIICVVMYMYIHPPKFSLKMALKNRKMYLKAVNSHNI